MNTLLMNTKKSLILLEMVLYAVTISSFEIIVALHRFNIYNAGITSLIQLILILMIFYHNDIKLLSFPSIFIMISYLFNLSHFILYLFNSPVILGYDMRNFTTPDAYQQAVVLIIRVHTCLFIGVLLSIALSLNKIKINIIPAIIVRSKKMNLKLISYIGYSLLLTGILPRLYIDLNIMRLYFSGSYVTTYNFNISGTLVILSRMVDIGVLFLLIGKKNKKKYCNFLIAFYLMYSILFMLSGNRGRAMVNILVIFLVYFTVVNALNFKKVIGLLVVGYLFLAFLVTISNTRNIVNFNMSQFPIYYIRCLTIESPIFKIFGEFGTTIKSSFYPIQYYTYKEGYSYGMNYIRGLLLFFPNFGGFLANITGDLTFVKDFTDKSIGGSYIGESYYSLKNFSMIFMLFLGFIIGKINKKFKFYKTNNLWLSYSMLLILLPPLLWWIRDYFFDIIRDFSWILLYVVLLYFLFLNRFIVKPDNKKKITEECND